MRTEEIIDIAKQKLDTYSLELAAYVAMNGATTQELKDARDQMAKLIEDIDKVIEE